MPSSRAACRTSRTATLNEKLSKTIERPRTTKPTHTTPSSCGCVRRSYASYIEKIPPPKNRKSATISAQKVALFTVAERVPLRRRLHAPPDADIKEDLIHGVGDRVRGLRDKRAGPGHVRRDRFGDRDRQVARESREDRAGRALGHLPAVFALGTHFGPERYELPRDRGLADSERMPVPQRRRGGAAKPRELVPAIGLRVLKVDPRLQSELDDARPDTCALGLGHAVEEGVLGHGHFAARARRALAGGAG